MTRHHDLSAFAALSFDCYGTLIDWESGIAAELEPWALSHGLSVSRDALLDAFAGGETLVQQQTPGMLYPQVLAETMRHLDRRYGVISGDDQLASFAGSVERWPAFPDSAESLVRLHERFRLVILSNIDRQSFATSAPKLGVNFDLVVTAQDVGAYKPSAQSFPTLLDAVAGFGIDRSRLLHVAQSLYHDHEPAQAAGLPTVWIDRRHDCPGFGATPAPQHAITPDWRFISMAAFADAALA